MSVIEVWCQAPGTPYYEVSSEGRVRSIQRTAVKKNRWGDIRPIKIHGRILKPWSGSAGYLNVYICGEGFSRKAVQIHRLVAEAFIGTPSGDVNHIDGVKTNNAASNLEWCTRTENMAHARKLGLVKAPRPVVATPKKGGIPLAFESVREAAEFLEIRNIGNVRSALVGGIPSAYGHTWSYA